MKLALGGTDSPLTSESDEENTTDTANLDTALAHKVAQKLSNQLDAFLAASKTTGATALGGDFALLLLPQYFFDTPTASDADIASNFFTAGESQSHSRPTTHCTSVVGAVFTL